MNTATYIPLLLPVVWLGLPAILPGSKVDRANAVQAARLVAAGVGMAMMNAWSS